jgi:hypothetical protein
VLAIQAQEHRLRAAHLDLLGEEALVDLARVVWLVEAPREILAEGVEGHRLALGAPAARREQVVDRHTVGPGLKRGVAAEAVQPGDELDHDLLRRVLRIFRVPEHPQRKAVDRILDDAHERLQGGAVAAPGALDGIGA